MDCIVGGVIVGDSMLGGLEVCVVQDVTDSVRLSVRATHISPHVIDLLTWD